MPPRRRGTTAAARAAAIHAVEKKRLELVGGSGGVVSGSNNHLNTNNNSSSSNNNNTNSTDSNNNNNATHEESHHPHQHTRSGTSRWSTTQPQPQSSAQRTARWSKRLQQHEEAHPRRSSTNNSDDTNTNATTTKSRKENNDDDDEDDHDEENGCLHCRRQVSPQQIQVRCDECHAYICQNCHWCHEFQANHEIRVCDRCDAFYCRNCDEMDQCDDCAEVVCASCSTLLSCKFCGGGLCEECATACGRCGIVLCSRDAKFAVDCDTCRLSYCLVCLASGTKDPCVRCGHRPSKRMEQLVHLRLKSIYKAFKQSSSASRRRAAAAVASAATHPNDDDDDDDDMDDDDEDDEDDDDNDDDVLIKDVNESDNKRNSKNGSSAKKIGFHEPNGETPRALLKAAASAASVKEKKSLTVTMSLTPGGSIAAATASTDPTTTTGTASYTTNLVRGRERDFVERYMAEKEKADAAAAALLAELAEEEEAIRSKKSKKKRKKERAKQQHQQQHREGDDEEEEDEDESEHVAEQNETDDIVVVQKVNPNVMDAAAPRMIQKESATLRVAPQAGELSHRPLEVMQPTPNATLRNDDSAEQPSANKKMGASALKQPTVPTASPPSVVDETPRLKSASSESDLTEQRLCELVANADVDGIEELLESIKGIPGRAALRKNAKKALKRLRTTTEEQQQHREEESSSTKMAEGPPRLGAVTPATQSETSSGVRCFQTHQQQPEQLVKVVSHTHYPNNSNTRNPPQSSAANGKTVHASSGGGVARTECVLHIAPSVVGWVIGKGGQRIRDLMEESGAKIWIDQDNLSPKDPRIVYVSGSRKSVDAAVTMIKDLVTRVPPTGVAPLLTPLTTSTASRDKEPSSLKAPLLPDAGGNASALNSPVSLPYSSKVKPRPSQAAPAQTPTNDPKSEFVVHDITCDPRFVPLLIGRRGWTIKHIQDSSGARVDIAQTVTPRRITISGREENVRSAMRMVRDVLSYPHAQLQGTGRPGTLEPTSPNGRQPPDPQPKNPAINEDEEMALIADAIASQQQEENEDDEESSERNHSPPPSSLIMTGDIRSTISASSSLSSTPEPSMASSSKGHYRQISAGHPPLPEFGSHHQYYAGGPAFAHQQQQRDVLQPRLGDGPRGAGMMNGAGMSMFSSGGPGMNGNEPHLGPQHYPMPAAAAAQGHIGFGQPMMPQGLVGSNIGGIRAQHHVTPGLNMDHPFPPRHASSADVGMVARQHLHHPTALRHQGVFQPSTPQYQRQVSAPETALQNLMHHNHSTGKIGPSLFGVANGLGPSVPGLWQEGSAGHSMANPASEMFVTNPGAEGYGLNSNSMLPNNGGLASGFLPPLGNGMGLVGTFSQMKGGIELDRSVSAPPSMLNPARVDESQMVDSLFGPGASAVAEVDDQAHLFSGFHSLSIYDDVAADVDVPLSGWSSALPVWGGGTQKVSPVLTTTELEGEILTSATSSLFGGVNEAGADTHQHPSQSRFGWVFTNES